MSRFEQFEIWEFNGGRWEFIASFRNFEVASVLARRRSYRVRLLHVTYEDGKAVAQEVLAEIGETRQEP
jgi:hypothetical protein